MILFPPSGRSGAKLSSRRETMNKRMALGCLALAGVLALASPSVLQELQWPPYRGYDVPFVPTPPEVVEEMLDLADIKAGDVLYDLGCGDGRIVIAAAKRFGIKAVGIDIDPVRISESNDNAAKEGVTGKVKFVQQNLFEADFKDASVITMYLLTTVNRRLRPKLLAELRPGTRLVSHSFDMGDWKPDRTSEVTTSYDDRRDVHFWVVPANVTGRWEWDLPDGSNKRRYTIQTTQKFQELSAAGTAGEWPLTFSDGSISGDEVKFRLDAEAGGKMVTFQYWGKVQGNTIVGTVVPADEPKAVAVKWKATRDPKTVQPLDTDGI
jgi:SAM-dependent methyltransferase